MNLALACEVAVRLVLAGAMLSSIASVLNALHLRARERLVWVSLAWAAVVLVYVVARAFGFLSAEDVGAASRVQYATTLLQVPLAFALVGAGNGVIVATVLVALVPFFGSGFVTAELVVREDLLGVPVRYPVPGVLVQFLAPYGIVVALVTPILARRKMPADPFFRRLVVATGVIVVPAGVNDLLMTQGVIRSVLLTDVAASVAVVGLMNELARRSIRAYDALLVAVDERREATKHGQQDSLLARKLSDLGGEVERVLSRIEAPLFELYVGISSMSSTLRTFRARKDDQALRDAGELADEAEDGVRRIQATVVGLRDFARPAQTGRESCDLAQLLGRALRIVHNDLVHRARILTRFEVAPRVDADPGRLVEVFVNLLLNAGAAILPEHWATARVTVTLGTDDAGMARVTIQDDGSGIPPDVIARLFEPYSAPNPTFEGAGLRLSISHRIVTACGGRVAVETSQRGTTVTLLLPPERRGEERSSFAQGAPSSRGR